MSCNGIIMIHHTHPTSALSRGMGPVGPCDIGTSLRAISTVSMSSNTRLLGANDVKWHWYAVQKRFGVRQIYMTWTRLSAFIFSFQRRCPSTPNIHAVPSTARQRSRSIAPTPRNAMHQPRSVLHTERAAAIPSAHGDTRRIQKEITSFVGILKYRIFFDRAHAHARGTASIYSSQTHCPLKQVCIFQELQ